MKNPNCVPDEDYLEFIPPKPKKLKKEKIPKGPVLSPESKAALRIQKRLVAAITKKTLRKKAAKKARKEKKKARLQAIANGEEVCALRAHSSVLLTTALHKSY